MTADDDEVILYNDEEMLIYQMGGRVRFRGTFNTAVTGVMRMGGWIVLAD